MMDEVVSAVPFQDYIIIITRRGAVFRMNTDRYTDVVIHKLTEINLD